MRQTITILSLFFLAALPLSLQATHIVGGEMTYKCLGNDLYEIKLTIFRDCFNGVPWFDDPASIGIFSNQTNLLIDEVFVPLDQTLNDTLDPTLDSECLVIPPNVCVHTTTYTTVVNLPFLPGGYHLVYQRCCRNNTIANLISPEDVGATYSIEIGEDALLACNSSPVFNDWPPLFLCAGLPYSIDQSAVDDDGDSLVYRLCNPLTGGTPADPMPQPPNNPPYDTVPWLFPYNVNNFTNNPPVDVMTIDPETGLLTGTPNVIGQFVIGICIDEYRDGELIGTNRRDYQVNIGDCEVITAAFFTPDVICGSLTVDIENESQNADDYLWFFNDPANPGATSTLPEPSYTYSDTGLYTITLIAEPGTVCADTSSAEVHFQPGSLFPGFDVQVTQCLDDLIVQATDLSVDTFSTIVSWDWVFEVGASTLTSDDQNPTFVAPETGMAFITLTVTAANGCEASFGDVFLLKSEPLVLELGPDLQLCFPQDIELTADPGFSSYEWSTTETTPSIIVNGEGTYSVTATDACGDTQVDMISIQIDTTELMLPDTVMVCQGGSFTFDVPGFISYEWTPSDFLSCTDCPDPTTTPTMDITYMLTAISADSCVSMGTTTVIVMPAFTSELTFEACEGETVTYEGTVLSAGDMEDFTFTASNGCDSIVTVTVNGLPNFNESITLEACEGSTVTYNGTELDPGTVTDFTFTASNGCDSIVTVTVEELPTIETAETIAVCFGETAEIFGMAQGTAGEYEMTFVASNGCDSTHTITLVVYDEITLAISAANATCAGISDGTATVIADGGSGTFTYLWSNGDTEASISGLAAGTYTVTATDDNNCTAEASVTVGQPTAVVVAVIGQDVTCDELGAASANASGGTPGYTYEWNTGDIGPDLTDLEAGNYIVMATDANGCVGSGSVVISGALGPDAVVTISQQVSEDEPSGGELLVEIIGGTAPFDIEWSNGATTDSLFNLGSGEYSVTVTDANGCTATGVAYLFVPACTGGKIWNDIDRDGCQEGGELGLGGILLELMGTDIWGNPVSATTVSEVNGEYIFEGLPPGDYQVFLPVPVEWVLSPANACTDDFTDSDFDMAGMSFVVDLLEGHCCLIVDGGLYDACLNVIDPGAICCDQTLCGPSNVPDPLTGPAATGAGGAVEYMWMFSHTGGSAGSGSWSVIPNTNSLTYAPGALYQTTYYTRCARAIGCDTWVEGDAVKITVDDEAVAQIAGPSSACVGDMVEYVSLFNNDPSATFSWNFGPWASPSTASTEDVTVTWNQAGVAYITLTVENNGCTSTAQMGVGISDSPNLCGNLKPGGGPVGFNFGNTTNFSFFPNPVTDQLTINWTAALEGELSIDLFSIDGRQLMATTADGGALSHRADVSGLVAGVYMLRVQDASGETKVFRVVKE